MFSQYPIEPVIELKDGFSPFDIWLECQAVHRLWKKDHNSSIKDEDRLQSVLPVCKRLSSFPAQRWLAFNSALGWAPAAAAAYTWCQDAVLSDTVKICNQLQYLASPAKNEDFCARLLNPSLLPQNRLSELVNAGGRQLHGISLLIAARPELPEIDLPKDILQNFPAYLLSMLNERGSHTIIPTANSMASTASLTGPVKVPAPASQSTFAGVTQKSPPLTNRNMRNTSGPEKQKQRQDLIERTLSLRGWTEEMVATAKAAPAYPVAVANYGECHRHMHPETGASIVVEAISGELLHVGQPGFAYRSAPDQEYDTADRYTDPFHNPETRRTMIWVPLKYELVETWCSTPAGYIERDIYCILPSLEDNCRESKLYSVTAYVHGRPVMFHDGVHIAAVKVALP